MFSLIITIISIALVAALAIASIYYGGSAFSQGSAKAAASTVVSQAQQVSAANVLYANDNSGSNAAGVATLVTDNYLASAPNMPSTIGPNSLDLSGSAVTTTGIVNKNVCDAINKQVGLDSTTTELTADNTAVQYDCFQTVSGTSGSYTFMYH